MGKKKSRAAPFAGHHLPFTDLLGRLPARGH